MTVIGSASINIRADDKYFEADVRRAVAKIKDVRIALKVDADMSAANKKLRDLRYRLSNQEVSIKIRANDAQFDTDVRAAVRKVKNVQIDLKADVDVAKASKKIRDLRYRITSKDAILKVDADLAKAEDKMRKFLEKFINTEVNITAKTHTGAAHTALTDLQTRYGRNVNFTATADTKVARAALAAAARNRRVKISPFLDSTSMAAIKGMFNVLTGTLPFDKIRTALSGIIANFEGIAVKAATVATALLSVSAMALTAGANIFSIAGDITQVITIAAMLPAAFIAMGTAIAANKMSWKGFGDAFDADAKKAAKAMALLPPEAQAAADGIRGVGKEIQKATQIKFWEAMGTSLQDMVQSLLPQLKEGFEGLGASLGSFEGTAFQSIQAAFGDGVLLGILQNISKMFDNMSEGLGGFIGAIATLGRVGATYLPDFGKWLGDAGNKFGEFIRQADEAGKINFWIENAVKRFHELTSVIGSTVDIFSGITDIARMSGAPGLTQMADGFKNVANVVNSEPFQSQLLSILEGARAGTGKLGEGLGTLTELFWKSSDSVSSFLELAGEVAGLTFSNITALFNGTGLGSGLYAALSGFGDGMEMLEPGFRDIGIALGDLGLISGEVFQAMAPGLNLLAETIKEVVGGLRDGFMDALPVLNTFMQAILDVASGPIVALANAFGSMLTAFSELPGVIQTVMMSLGLFLLLKGKFGSFFSGLGTSLRKEDSVIGNTFRKMRTNLVDTAAVMRSDMGRVGTSIRTVMTESATLAGKTAGAIRSAFGTMATGIKDTLVPIGKNFGSYLMGDGGLDRVKTGFNDLRYNAATNFAAMSMAASMQGQIIKGHFTDAAAKIGTKFADIKGAAQRGLGAVGGFASSAKESVGNHFNNMAKTIDGHLGKISPMATRAFNNLSLSASAAGSLAGQHISNMAKAVDGHLGKLSPMAQKAFNGMSLGAAAAGSLAGQHIGNMAKTIDGHLGKVSPSAQQAFRGMSTFALSAKDAAGGHIGNMAKAIDGHLGKISPLAQRAFSSMGTIASSAAGAVGGHMNNMASTIDGHLGKISPSAQRAFNTLGLNAQAATILAQDHISRMPAAMGEVAGRVGASFSGAATSIGDTFRGAVTRVGDSFGTLHTRASDAAGRVGAALAPVRTAFSDLATHAAAMGTTAGRGFSSGIATAAGGLSAALGGPWGIAIMGATVLLGSFAQQNQKAKQSVQDLTGTLDKQTGDFSNATRDQIGKIILQLDQGKISKWLDQIHGAGDDVDVILDNVGLSIEDVTDKLTAPGNKEYIENWKKIGIEAAKFMPISEELANSVGSTSAEMDAMDTDELMKMSVRIERAGVAAIKAQEDVEKLAKAMGTSTIEAQKLQKNFDTLASTTSSVTEKVSALQQNLDILNGGKKTAADASKAYEQSLRDTAGAIEEIGSRAGVSIPTLYEVGEGFKFADQAAADLHTALGGQAEAILTTAMTAFQAARDGGDEVGVAQEKALNAMTAPLESFKQSLAAMGFMPEQIQGIVEEFGLVPADVRTAMGLDGAQEAVAEAARVKIQMDAIANGEYNMVLAALPDEAKAALTETMGLGDAFARGDYEAILTALDGTAGGKEAALLALTSYEGEDWETELKARNLVPEEVAKANAAASALMKEKNVDLVANDLATGILDNVAAYSLDGKTVTMTGEDLVSDILNNINSSNLMDKDSKLTAEDLVTQAIEHLNTTQLDGKMTTLDMKDLATKVMEDYNALSADGKVSTLEANDLASMVIQNLEGVKMSAKDVKIVAFDEVYPGVSSAKKSVDDGLKGVGEAKVTVTDESKPGLDSAKKSIEEGVSGIGGGGGGGGIGRSRGGNLQLALEAYDNTAPGVSSAQGTMEMLSSVVRDLEAQNLTGTPTAESQATMNTLQDVYADLIAENKTGGPLVASQATMDSLQSVMRELQAQDATGGGTNAAQGTMNSLQSVMRDLNAANNTGGPVGEAQRTINGVNGKTVDVIANDKGSENAYRVRDAISTVVGKTVDVVTNFFRRDHNAEGGVYNGAGEIMMAKGGIIKSASQTATQTFANGGFSGVNSQAVKAFAGGGVENHTAQIARGAWPVRIWAEPETGGEAYIPLSKNKRKRSLDILKMVMAEFGIQGMMNGKAFANGGIMPATQAPAVVSSRYSAPMPRTDANGYGVTAVTDTTPIVVQVNPSAALDERQVGEAAARELYWQMVNN